MSTLAYQRQEVIDDDDDEDSEEEEEEDEEEEDDQEALSSPASNRWTFEEAIPQLNKGTEQLLFLKRMSGIKDAMDSSTTLDDTLVYMRFICVFIHYLRSKAINMSYQPMIYHVGYYVTDCYFFELLHRIRLALTDILSTKKTGSALVTFIPPIVGCWVFLVSTCSFALEESVVGEAFLYTKQLLCIAKTRLLRFEATNALTKVNDVKTAIAFGSEYLLNARAKQEYLPTTAYRNQVAIWNETPEQILQVEVLQKSVWVNWLLEDGQLGKAKCILASQPAMKEQQEALERVLNASSTSLASDEAGDNSIVSPVFTPPLLQKGEDPLIASEAARLFL